MAEHSFSLPPHVSSRDRRSPADERRAGGEGRQRLLSLRGRHNPLKRLKTAKEKKGNPRESKGNPRQFQGKTKELRGYPRKSKSMGLGSALRAARPGRQRPKSARREDLGEPGFASNARARQASRWQPFGNGLRGPALGLPGQCAAGRGRHFHKQRLASGVERPALIHLEPEPMQQRQPRNEAHHQMVRIAALMEEPHR